MVDHNEGRVNQNEGGVNHNEGGVNHNEGGVNHNNNSLLQIAKFDEYFFTLVFPLSQYKNRHMLK